MRWELMTEEEIEDQHQGFRVTIGNKGYLREAYHGDPYATKVLVPEAFDAHGAEVKIAAAILRERLPLAMKAALRREREVYRNSNVNEDSPVIQSFVSFVELAEELEEQGREYTVVASY
jgi:hypothetical protein